MDKLQKLEMVLDTFMECARECDRTEGLSIVHFSTIPGNGNEKNSGLVCGTPHDIIMTLLKAMSRDQRIRNIVITAASAYKVFDKVMGDSIRDAKAE